ncbi:DUF1467 family protein [Qingshengfaniella alkalisoli]|uniref:DUF1467 family protein n=1 Tax=Qingshengfaniella alkalisoli TaxID=2599296 RepID=A0A5B8I9T6_9RHOB|nr:DUF1467 family protein [Qingshengfaniella alkalisoli]QDY69836.1 DUF1467 family protein [Qingshengfaniella alkalisoli]
MSITGAIVLFAVIWFMTFLCALPIRLKTQGDVGECVPGTHVSSPVNPNIGKKARITTVVTLVLWAIIFGIIASGTITVRDIDVMNHMHPLTDDDTGE